jgi:hypothetical protein
MSIGSRWRAFERNPVARSALMVLGVVLLIAAPIVGLLPGPGGFPLAILALTLLLRYSRWTKRLYVRLKRRWPKHGALADRGLRRPSARRRAKLSRQQAN